MKLVVFPSGRAILGGEGITARDADRYAELWEAWKKFDAGLLVIPGEIMLADVDLENLEVVSELQSMHYEPEDWPIDEYLVPEALRETTTPKHLRIHSARSCDTGHCVFHNPSVHAMVAWPINVRLDRFGALAERICPHGIGHPDPDSLAYVESLRPADEKGADGVHGCDGCCQVEKEAG